MFRLRGVNDTGLVRAHALAIQLLIDIERASDGHVRQQVAVDGDLPHTTSSLQSNNKGFEVVRTQKRRTDDPTLVRKAPALDDSHEPMGSISSAFHLDDVTKVRLDLCEQRRPTQANESR